MNTTDLITIRRSEQADRPAVARLAALDSKRPPRGDLLVAEIAGDVVAAVPVAGGETIADPFRRTAELVALLELRAGQIAAGDELARARARAARGEAAGELAAAA